MSRKFVLGANAPSGPFTHKEPAINRLVFVGDELPIWMAPFDPGPFSHERYVEDYLNNGRPRLTDTSIHTHESLELRPYQEDVPKAIKEAKDAGSPGFLYADPTGSGKMITSALYARDNVENGRVLVVSPLSSLHDWRRTISDVVGVGSNKWTVINYESLWRIFKSDFTPDELDKIDVYERIRILSRSGSPLIPFDLIILDESHRIANFDTIRFDAIESVIRSCEAFTIYASATPLSSVRESTYLARLMAWRTNTDTTRIEDEGMDALLDRIMSRHFDNTDGIEVVKNILFGDGLKKPKVGISRTKRDVGLPEQSRELTPIQLSAAEMGEYEKNWMTFLKDHGMSTYKQRDPNTVHVEAARALQRASFLKIPYVAERVDKLVREGYQVILIQWYRDSMKALHQKIMQLAGNEYFATTLDGSDTPSRRAAKIGYFNEGTAITSQGAGRVGVIITNIVEAINLHEGAGKSGLPRRTVIADVISGGKRAMQAEGRGQRDGYIANAEYMYSSGTVEERLLARSLEKTSKTELALGHDEESDRLYELSTMLDRDILIPGMNATETKVTLNNAVRRSALFEAPS